MDDTRLDDLARSLSGSRSRRAALVALLGGVGVLPSLAGVAESKKSTKKTRKKPLRLNGFGCVNVGGQCRGNSANCCSGICSGKKPRKGARDKSTCLAHDQSTCQPGQVAPGCSSLADPLPGVACTSSAGKPGDCNTTTGNAGYCRGGGLCVACKRDADCVSTCGPQAACITCDRACAAQGLTTQCVGPDTCTPPI